MAYTSQYIIGDIPNIAVDAFGTAGAAAVSWIPLAVTGGVLYVGAKYGKKKYAELKARPKKSMCGKGWHYDSYRHSMAAKGIKIYRRY